MQSPRHSVARLLGLPTILICGLTVGPLFFIRTDPALAGYVCCISWTSRGPGTHINGYRRTRQEYR